MCLFSPLATLENRSRRVRHVSAIYNGPYPLDWNYMTFCFAGPFLSKPMVG